MTGRIAPYSLGIGIVGLAGAIFKHLVYDAPILPERLPLVLVLAPLFGFLVWLRWDWAAAKRRERAADRGEEAQ